MKNYILFDDLVVGKLYNCHNIVIDKAYIKNDIIILIIEKTDKNNIITFLNGTRKLSIFVLKDMISKINE